MTVKNTLANVANAVNPKAYNPNAFNLITYARTEKQRDVVYFAQRPESGLSRFEEILESSGILEPPGIGTPEAAKLGESFTVSAAKKRETSSLGMAVAFLDNSLPMAAAINVATGAWTFAQAQSALAAVDRTNVFRAAGSIPGQEAAGTVVESSSSLDIALMQTAKVSKVAIIQSNVQCSDMRLVNVSGRHAPSTEIYEAAATTSKNNRLIVTPFIGLKASQREICCDGIVVDGDIVFSAFSEKRRVDPHPPFQDRRITTLDTLDCEDEVKSVITQLLQKLGVKHAVFHSEHSLSDKGPLLSDFMTRPGGGFIPEMVLTKFGVDLRAAHIYASFAMTDDLMRMAKQAKDSGKGVAIAALYGDADKTSVPALQKALSKKKNDVVVAYSIVNEASNSVVGTTDLRAALCITGRNSDAALERLEAIAEKHGLD